MSTRFIRNALFATITFATPTLAMAEGPVAAVTANAPKTAAADEAVSYSQRETQEPQAAQFEGGLIESTAGGGTVIVISGVALVAFLALALLLL